MSLKSSAAFVLRLPRFILAKAPTQRNRSTACVASPEQRLCGEIRRAPARQAQVTRAYSLRVQSSPISTNSELNDLDLLLMGIDPDQARAA